MSRLDPGIIGAMVVVGLGLIGLVVGAWRDRGVTLARNVPPATLRQWANNERANRAKHLLAANDLVLGRTRP